MTTSSANAAARIIGTQGGVVLVGFAPGTLYTVYTLACSAVATGTIDSDYTTVALPTDIYIVKADGQVVKAIATLK